MHQLTLLDVPIAGLYPLDVDEANALVELWGHRLGACHRPFGQQAFCLRVQGEALSVAISASIVSATVAGYRRNQVVECARLCSVPGVTWANRLMVRLWREVCAPLWPYWPVHAAISYSHNAYHRGELYRTDGWTKEKDDCGSMGGGAWTRQRYATEAVVGKKTLWVWRYGEERQRAQERERLHPLEAWSQGELSMLNPVSAQRKA